jgi:hypothetical protein
VQELYDLAADIGETTDVSGRHPDVVAALTALAERGKEDLGCEASGIPGSGRRPAGQVENPRPLTEYDPEHPYIIAMYDLEEAG